MGIRNCLEKIVLSSTIMALSTFLLLRIIGKAIVLQTFFAVLIQTVIALVFAFSVYIIVSKLLKSRELFSIKEAFLRR
jgi:hypothetical protein